MTPDALRRLGDFIDNAVEMPGPLTGYVPKPVPPARRGVAKALIAPLGVAEADTGESIARWGIPESVYLYRDFHGVPRALGADRHDHGGILSLFAGDERLLRHLWPGGKHFNRYQAAEDLFCRQAEIGLVHVPAGFARPLTAETAIEIAAHHGIGALARRQLCRGTAPYTVLNLARGWNSASGRPVLSDDIVIAIVDGACARELARESRDDAA